MHAGNARMFTVETKCKKETIENRLFHSNHTVDKELQHLEAAAGLTMVSVFQFNAGESQKCACPRW